MYEIIERFKDIISGFQVELWESEPTTYRLKARISLIDQSELRVKDYLLAGGRKYAYHWQSASGKLLIRWDNAPHWKNIATHPHHKHVGTSRKVVESTEVSLEEVLTIIQGEINK